MMLTLSKPAKWDFDVKTHDYPPPFTTSTTTRHSPKLNGGPSPPHTAGPNYAMNTSHRGLPPPSAMTLPDPGRGPPPIQSSMGSSSLGALPPAPTQWQGSEDGMKNWLTAKAEEEKRKQEEEKTRQENLKLEQRKIEHSMLRESMQGGIPPHLVPIIFAGIGGGNLANISAEWIQQYTAQVQAAHQQAQAQAQAQLSPELRRETRLLGQQPQTVYAGQPPVSQTILPPTAVLPGQPLPAQSQQYASERALPGPSHAGPPTSAPRPLHRSQLPKLTTNEMHIQQPASAQPGVQQLQQTQNAQEQSSPSIYFHHWVPPTSQQEKNTSGNPPATPSGKYKSSPSTSYQSRQRATSHASDREYISSPKKRKAQGPHAAPPPPTSAPQSYTSPSFSYVSTSSTSTPGRRGHARARSDASARGAEGTMSRRSTVSGLANETRQSYIQDPPRAPEGRHPHNPDAPYGTPPQRSESRGYVQQSPAPNAGSGQPETPKYGTHQQWSRGYHPSPKREADR
ncbi:hypothetical protein BU25DRAFT_190490 [Macroventuria anomochaeta]|uniref:Uncharacterized protein n=1 Tax=Macroventuria anomochaeta TaxID=301207 RepID=A0ACB6SBZ8_9PLEO|nr:uncharacterized protein BU25DRAFT_190490 [Macroventuria anomochaeta]KAF2631533.1 hypothetical protein BU25DRAFT_190490 [Macroventuria anomochaeta]